MTFLQNSNSKNLVKMINVPRENPLMSDIRVAQKSEDIEYDKVVK